MGKQNWYYKCTECGSTDVEMKGWTRPNNYGEFVDLCSEKIEKEDCYCNECDDHVKLEYIELKEGENAMNKKIQRCKLCHSTDVTCKAHVKPNSGNLFAGYSQDEDDKKNSYCNRCETHVPLEEAELEETNQLPSPPEIFCTVDAKSPFSMFTNGTDGQWAWIADYSQANEYRELDEIFAYLHGDIYKKDLPAVLCALSDNELREMYNNRFQSMFGKALQKIGKAIESRTIEIVSQFTKQ